MRRRTSGITALVLIVVCAGLLPAGAQGGVTYEKMSLTAGSPHPFPRDAFGVAPGDGDSFYLFGGVFEYFKSDTPLYKHYGDLWKFTWTGTTGTWTLEHGCDADEPLCGGGPCNPTTDHCDGLLTSPTVRAFPAVASLVFEETRYVAVFGGTYFTKTFENAPRPDSFWLYNTTARSWQNLTPLPGLGPDPRNGSVAAADGDKLYIFGGINGALATYNDVWEFDLSTGKWRLLSPNTLDLDPASEPHSRHAAHGALVTHDGQKRLIVYGGEYLDPTSETGFVIPDDTWEFNPATTDWTPLAQTPLPDDVPNKPVPTRNYAAFSANAAGNLFVLQGGDIEGGVHGCGALFFENPGNDVWVYDRAADAWSPKPLSNTSAVPSGAKRHGGVQVGHSMYVMGGWEFVCDAMGNGPGQVFNTDVYRFKNL